MSKINEITECALKYTLEEFTADLGLDLVEAVRGGNTLALEYNASDHPAPPWPQARLRSAVRGREHLPESVLRAKRA
jgi:hypothetical protein